MSIMFSPAEVFDIAIQIERNGAAFYRKAAAMTKDENTQDELDQLAQMEDEHEATFLKLKKTLLGNEDQETGWYDPEDDAALYLQSFAAGQVFDMTKDISGVLTPHVTVRKVLELAIERERDSIVFFLGMKELVPAGRGAKKIDSIIKQEMSHITLLGRRLSEM